MIRNTWLTRVKPLKIASVHCMFRHVSPIIKGKVVPYVHISKAAYQSSRFYFIKSRFKFRRVYPPNLGLGRGIKQINNYFFMQNPENFNLGWLKFLDGGGMLPCCCWMPDMCSSIGTKKQTNEENTFSSIN
jgi:hypothetical protein